MSDLFPKPFQEAIIYQDRKLYVCLANNPIELGHVIVVWNKPVKDLNLLSRKNYDYLMEVVSNVRKAMIRTLKVKKVYLLYMDEINHVHWHLIPRYKKMGLDNLSIKPGKIKDFSLENKIRKNLIISVK
ncbi:MAG: HIT family protein [Patescibacteria group bacterium]